MQIWTQETWDEAQDSAFVSSSQAMLMMLVQGAHFDSKALTATEYKCYACQHSDICINSNILNESIYNNPGSPSTSENACIGLVKNTNTIPENLTLSAYTLTWGKHRYLLWMIL